MRHLANAQYWDRPAGGNTGRLFLAFGGPVCADRISNCPLDRVLTYKNLIYLLNLQFCSCEKTKLRKFILFWPAYVQIHCKNHFYTILLKLIVCGFPQTLIHSKEDRLTLEKYLR